MSVIEDLTEEERYLFCILSDASGLDLAEFCLVDEENADGCFRAWPFQWSWWRCNDPLQLDQCARSVGKSKGVSIRAFAFPFARPGQEMVVTAPELVHLEPLTSLIEERFYSTRLGREMMVRGRSSVTHRPFQINFRNGARIIGRIPQKDGKGMKGIHPLVLEMDEAQDFPHPGWIELIETLKRGSAGAQWRAHGVTRGVRDKFFELSTDPESGWTIHRFAAMWRPNWSDEERAEKIKNYGSRDDADYRRNVLGEHGDETSPIFVLHRLMQCVDDELESEYNTEEYYHVEVTDSMLREMGGDITSHLDFPPIHRKRYETFWVGMDVGMTNHPSEILVFAEERMNAAGVKALKARNKAAPEEGETRLKLLTRLTLKRVSAPDQVRAILAVIDFYKPRAFSFDSTGVGLPLFQEVQERNVQAATTVKGYNFSGKILVDFDQTVELGVDADPVKEAGIMRNTVDYATDKIRYLIDNRRYWLPWDKDLISEYQGQTYKITRTTLDQYGRREYSLGSFHALDAARMATLGWAQYAIEELMKAPKDTPVLDVFMY